MEKHLERQRKQEAEEKALAEAAAKRRRRTRALPKCAAEARKQRQVEKKATQKERARLRGLTADQGAPLPASSPPCSLTWLSQLSRARAVPWLCEDWSPLPSESSQAVLEHCCCPQGSFMGPYQKTCDAIALLVTARCTDTELAGSWEALVGHARQPQVVRKHIPRSDRGCGCWQGLRWMRWWSCCVRTCRRTSWQP